jgi:hypothetical protein
MSGHTPALALGHGIVELLECAGGRPTSSGGSCIGGIDLQFDGGRHHVTGPSAVITEHVVVGLDPDGRCRDDLETARHLAMKSSRRREPVSR